MSAHHYLKVLNSPTVIEFFTHVNRPNEVVITKRNVHRVVKCAVATTLKARAYYRAHVRNGATVCDFVGGAK